MSLLLYLLFSGGAYHTGWLWILMFPAFVFLLDSKKKGRTWVVSFGVILFLLILLQYGNWIDTAYGAIELIILLIVYGFVSDLIYIFKKEIDYYTDQLRSINSVLEHKVNIEIKKNKQKDILLNNQAKQAQMGEIISMIAHQWRQPLNAISAASINLNLQSKMKLSNMESIEETSRFIQKKVQEMSEVIDTFMEFVKPQEECKDFFPLVAIQKALSIIGSQLSNHTITVEVDNSDAFKTYNLYGVINLFEQILINLLINTRDAFDDYSQIEEKTIRIYGNEKGAIIFEDNAGGIPKAIQNKVFNPYFTTKEQGKGTGLGLYLCRKIMKNHFKGDLVYQSIENGSRFIMTFAKKDDINGKS
jgi:signal transduction histidine kinase